MRWSRLVDATVDFADEVIYRLAVSSLALSHEEFGNMKGEFYCIIIIIFIGDNRYCDTHEAGLAAGKKCYKILISGYCEWKSFDKQCTSTS